MTKYHLYLYLFTFSFCFSAKGQNGHYVAESYRWVKYPYDPNPEITYNKYILEVSISEFSGRGEIIVRNLNTNGITNHILSAKIKEGLDEETGWYVVKYSSTLSLYSVASQPEIILLYIDPDTRKLHCMFSSSLEYGSVGSYCELKPIEEILPSTGTGFIVSSSGYIITNYHVVEGASRIIIGGINGDKKYDAYLKKYDEDKDIALLKIEDNNYPVMYSISKEESDVGESIFVLGYPMISVMGSEIKLTDGLISSASGFMNNKLYYQISSPIQPGNSGCPLFDSEGNVIGLVTSKLTDGENVGYALKSNEVIKFLLANNVSIPSNSAVKLMTSLSQKVKTLKQGIITIESIRE